MTVANAIKKWLSTYMKKIFSRRLSKLAHLVGKWHPRIAKKQLGSMMKKWLIVWIRPRQEIASVSLSTKIKMKKRSNKYFWWNQSRTRSLSGEKWRSMAILLLRAACRGVKLTLKVWSLSKSNNLKSKASSLKTCTRNLSLRMSYSKCFHKIRIFVRRD